MKSSHLVSTALGGLIALGSVAGIATPAKADTGSTIAIAGAAALIVGSLLSDSSGRSYYVRNNQRHYVSHDTAVYYRSHHGGGNYGGGYNGGGYNRGGNMGHGMDRNNIHGNMGNHGGNMGNHGGDMGNHGGGDHRDHH
jgi:hypothetical protein